MSEMRKVKNSPAVPGGVISVRRGPSATSAAISEQMSRMPRISTGPELAVRRELHRRGVRFVLHRRDLPGTPDIVLSRAKVAIFVDGCFWHGCPEHGTLPKNNRTWWEAKLRSNSDRDRRKDEELAELGWWPIHVWEHESVTEAARRIECIWAARIGSIA
jgi:DNA mismatch endonuclease (patch repair protein)